MIHATPFDRLLERAQGGDEDAFAALWRSYQPGLLRYLRVMAGAEADDLAADTWVQVVRTLDRFAGDERDFRAWMFTIARHRHIDWRRRVARTGSTPVNSDVLEARPSKDDTQLVVEERQGTEAALAVIATLPDDQAEAVSLRIIADLDVATVAEIMGRPAGTVRVLAHRGLRRLAEKVAAPPVPTGAVPPASTVPAPPRSDDRVVV